MVFCEVVENRKVSIMRKFVYESPEIEIITFATLDVVTTSGEGGEGDENIPESTQPQLPWDF